MTTTHATTTHAITATTTNSQAGDQASTSATLRRRRPVVLMVILTLLSVAGLGGWASPAEAGPLGDCSMMLRYKLDVNKQLDQAVWLYWGNWIARENIERQRMEVNRTINNFLLQDGCPTAVRSSLSAWVGPNSGDRFVAPHTPVGTPIFDRTVVSGIAPTGTITYKLYGPNDPTCAKKPVFTSTKDNVRWEDTISDVFKPKVTGTYRWSAQYSGDINNEPSSVPCTEAGQSNIVDKATPFLVPRKSKATKVGKPIHLFVELQASGGTDGMVSFKLYGPDATASGAPSCNTTPVYVKTVKARGDRMYGGHFVPTTPGNYHWSVEYSGDADSNPVSSPCGGPGFEATVAPAS